MRARPRPVEDGGAPDRAPPSVRAELDGDAGVDPERFPVVAERLAIDVTDALRAADAGARAFTGRPFARRMWASLTGETGRRRAGALGDLLAAQRAALEIARDLMRAEARTAYCVHRVLVNLHQVNRDLDALADEVQEDIDAAFLEIEDVRRTLLAASRAESARLDRRLATLQSALARESQVRRLAESYRAGALYRGLDAMLGAGMFMASVGQLFWGAGEPRRQAELAVALAMVKSRLPARPMPTEEALLATVSEASPDACASIVYASEGRGPCLAVVAGLAERRLAGLPVAQLNAADAVAIARATHRAEGVLARGLVRPVELATALASELTADEAGPVQRAARRPPSGDGADGRGDHDEDDPVVEEVQPWTPSRARSR